MPVNSELMKTMTTMKICQATPIAAFPVKPTRWPTSTWSTIPCSPPMMFVSIVGHASFHTAGRSGPSTIDRSYRPAADAGGAVGAGAAVRDGEGSATGGGVRRVCVLTAAGGALAAQEVLDGGDDADDLRDLALLRDPRRLVAGEDLEHPLVGAPDPPELAARVLREPLRRLAGPRGRLGDHRRLQLVVAGEDEGRSASLAHARGDGDADGGEL